MAAVEKTREFKGLYHVLMGALSPLQGVGPDDLKIKSLLGRVDDQISANNRVSARVSRWNWDNPFILGAGQHPSQASIQSKLSRDILGTWSTVFGTWAAVTTEMVCGSNPSVCAANRSCPPDATLIWPGFQWNVDWMSVFGSKELVPCARTVSCTSMSPVKSRVNEPAVAGVPRRVVGGADAGVLSGARVPLDAAPDAAPVRPPSPP